MISDDVIRLLLVEDDEIDRMAVRRALRAGDQPVDIHEAGDGATALQMLREHHFDCVLLDYQLPDCDGLEVLNVLRASGIRAAVIMLTGQGDERVAVDMMKAGANDYLVKGRLTLETLAHSIRNAVRIRRAEAEAELAQHKLRESEQRFRTMADVAPVMIWIAGPDSKCSYVNKVWLDFTGRSLEQELGDGWTEGIHPDDLPHCTKVHAHTFLAHKPFEMEYRLRRHDGAYRWVFDRGTPLFLPDGTFNGFIGSCIDITERKTAELNLQSAKETAEAANRAKDQFLAVLSHELRTPLAPVLTTVVMLEHEPDLTPEMRSSLEMIRRNVELEARLIDDLLDLTRISKGKLQLNLETVDGHSIVRNAVEICRSEIGGKQLLLDVQLDAEDCHVRADPARLQQVLWNLVKNAVKFTPVGGRILVRSQNVDGQLRIEVTDTGIGIERQRLDRIFDAFEQGEAVISRRFGGLGLGLTISRALIDMHGGELTADSPGHSLGSTFAIRLETVQPAPTRHEQKPSVPQPARQTLRILMVDDHEDTSRAMKRLLERLGYNVETADSVQSALQATQMSKFDLLISDIGLPDGSGLDLMRQLRQEGQIKGIALSGFGMEEDLKRSREAGFAEHLTKPINFRRLEAAIQQVLAG